jgi:hypothetical protein
MCWYGKVNKLKYGIRLLMQAFSALVTEDVIDIPVHCLIRSNHQHNVSQGGISR